MDNRESFDEAVLGFRERVRCVAPSGAETNATLALAYAVLALACATRDAGDNLEDRAGQVAKMVGAVASAIEDRL